MTSQFDFSQPYSPTGVNIYGSAITATPTEDFQRPTWRRLVSPDPKKYLVQDLTVWMLNNGYQKRGQLVGTATSTLDQRYGLSLPPKIQTSTVNISQAYPQSWTHFGILKKLAMAMGSGSGTSLFCETSATDPTPVATNYNPGANIWSLSPIVIGGVTTERLAVGLAGAATAVLSAIGSGSSTVDGSMHANTATMWGLLRSPLNAATPGTDTLLIYAGAGSASMYTLPITSAIGTAPTAVLTGIPSGGCALEVEQLQKNEPLRSYWCIPEIATYDGGTPVSCFSYGLGNGFNVMSISLEGTNPRRVPFKSTRLFGAAMWNRMVAVHDGQRVLSYDGEQQRDLHLLRNRGSNSDLRWFCQSIGVSGGELFAVTGRADLVNLPGAIGSSTLQVERYLPEFDAWVPASGVITPLGSSIPSGAPIYPTLPYLLSTPVVGNQTISQQTSHLHMNSLGNIWFRQFIPPEGLNPLDHYNQTGAANRIAQTYEASGTFTSSEFPIPNAGRNPTVLYEIDGTQMNTLIGGTASKVTVTWGEQSTTSQSWAFTNALTAEFLGSEPQAKLYKFFGNNTSTFTLGKFQIVITQGGDTEQTPQALPITFRMITYLDGKVDKPPIAVMGNV